MAGPKKEREKLRGSRSANVVPGVVARGSYKQFLTDNKSNGELRDWAKSHGSAALRELWESMRIEEERRGVKETTAEEAIETIKGNVPAGALDGWFRAADSGYKPTIRDAILSNSGVLNAGLNIAYKNYRDDGGTASFEKWAKTPVTMYRGDDDGKQRVASDVFVSFTPDRRVAEKFGKNITTIKIRPIDTYGSMQTTGEQEFLVPVRKIGR